MTRAIIIKSARNVVLSSNISIVTLSRHTNIPENNRMLGIGHIRIATPKRLPCGNGRAISPYITLMVL
jgi:hypothetical protein